MNNNPYSDSLPVRQLQNHKIHRWSQSLFLRFATGQLRTRVRYHPIIGVPTIRFRGNTCSEINQILVNAHHVVFRPSFKDRAVDIVMAL